MRFRRRPSLSVVPSAPPSPFLCQHQNADEEGPSSALDLDIALDVAVHAAAQNTGATAVAIALMGKWVLVCRARFGAIAPELGVALDVSSGITGACVRTAQVLKCDDTERDELVDTEVCRSLGIRSIVVIPILVDGAVTGLLEVLSDRPRAFTAVHVHWLQKVAGLVRNLAYRQATLAPIAPGNVAPEVTTKLDDVSEELPALTSIPEITGNAAPDITKTAAAESAGVAAFRDVLDRTAQSANWDDICQQLVSQLQK